ncbi:MAG: GMP/IMP nucleotidase, partial [Pseudomonadales bacterium]|nr:GMP/IMP nucleotidase [Pseudomonadales bacterium]
MILAIRLPLLLKSPRLLVKTVAINQRGNNMVNWQDIDTVLLDMDGTLLDLHFDNYFWLHYLPEKYASAQNISLDNSKEKLRERYLSQSGKLNWYCLDFWSEELDLNVLELKQDIRHLIAYRPHTKLFLKQLAADGKKRILLTNAHPDSLQLKLDHTQLHHHLDAIHSSHSFDRAKEDKQFWPSFLKTEPLDISRTLFIDASIAVL